MIKNWDRQLADLILNPIIPPPILIDALIEREEFAAAEWLSEDPRRTHNVWESAANNFLYGKDARYIASLNNENFAKKIKELIRPEDWNLIFYLKLTLTGVKHAILMTWESKNPLHLSEFRIYKVARNQRHERIVELANCLELLGFKKEAKRLVKGSRYARWGLAKYF